jgi:outer membrane assembly lipoprotein YfiO
VLIAALVCSFGAAAQWTWTPQTGRWINLKNLPKETPELQVEFARSLMLDGKYDKALRETGKFKEFYGDSEYADDNQFLRGEIKMAQGNLRGAANEFQQVIAGYPNTDLYDKAIGKEYEIGDGLYALGEKRIDKKWRLYRKRPFKHAIEVYSTVIESKPFTQEAAQAQYKVGLCRFTRKEYTTAAYEYRRVVEDYPDSEWTDDASHGLAVCYYTASLPPEYDQTPSALATRAIDDFAERYPADARLEDLNIKRVEMRENMARQRLNVARFYERRRKFKAARISYQLVLEQFADTRAAEDAKEWLAKYPAPETPVAEGPKTGT